MAGSTYDEFGIELPDREEQEYVSKRGRRILTALIVILIIILLITTFLLTQLIRPAGIPSQEDLGGVTWVRSIYGYGPDISQMTEPASVAVDPDEGALWVSDQIRFRLVKYDGSGRFLQEFSGDSGDGDTFNFPSSITVAPDGWLYVAESTYDTVRVYDENLTLQQTIAIPAPLSVAANNEMAVIGAEAGFAAYSRDGELIGVIGTRGRDEDQFDKVNGVALDEDSNAYIVDSFNNRISKYDAEGFRVWMVETGPPGNQAMGEPVTAEQLEEYAEQYPAFMQVPMGATLDGAGRLVVIDLLDFSIAAFDTEDGSFLGKWGEYGREDGKFAYPADIDYDAEYDWFVVADSGNSRAQIIRLPDSGESPLAAARRLLSGPLRACCFPLVVLLIILVLWVIMRHRNRNRETASIEAQDVESGAGPT